MVGTEWNESQVTRTLDRVCQPTLMLGADTGLAPRLDLPAVSHIPTEAVCVLVVYVLYVVHAEPADLPSAVVAWPASPAASGAESTAARSASAGSRTARPAARRSTARSAAWGSAAGSGAGRPARRSWGRGWWLASLCRHSHSPLLRRLKSGWISLGRSGGALKLHRRIRGEPAGVSPAWVCLPGQFVRVVVGPEGRGFSREARVTPSWLTPAIEEQNPIRVNLV